MAGSRTHPDTFHAAARFESGGRAWRYFSLPALEKAGVAAVSRLPYGIRILLENVLRNEDDRLVTANDVRKVAAWSPLSVPAGEVPFIPARVLLQDFTGVPVLADLAAMRDAAAGLGIDPGKVNPLVPVDLVIDHSVVADCSGTTDARERNEALEYARNRERYEFIRWGQRSFTNLRVVPPSTGICHQVNLEHLSGVVLSRERDGVAEAFPDTCIGTDSHTTTVNGLAVLGWGVGGIEAEAAMLGHPVPMLVPEVIGVRLTGRLPEGSTATDLVLTLTQLLRKRGVVGRFVEFLGAGVATLSLPDRATVANMAPEYGATVGFFPADDRTIEYLKLTGRTAGAVSLAEAYLKAQGLFRTAGSPDPGYTDILELDLGKVEPSLAGPKRPHDRVPLKDMKTAFARALTAPVKEGGFASSPAVGTSALAHGSVVLAAITSCTNTSNPSLMVAAGLLAKKAVERGLAKADHVKATLSPGSRVVTDYLASAGLTPFLEELGFHNAGYGCMTCIGNSGPLLPGVSEEVRTRGLVVAGVLSGNRNFEGRINPDVKANYLASPPLVVAYAIAGRVDIDLGAEPLGMGRDGKPVFLREVWPADAEVAAALAAALRPGAFVERYASVFEGDARWKALPVPEGARFTWAPASTYVRRPPYFDGLAPRPGPVADIRGARVLAVLGDSVTTDHISPAGSIKPDSPAGRYLVELAVAPADFNSYGSRRGNHEVLVRGTFANIRLRNLLAPGTEGGVTVNPLDGRPTSIYEAATACKAAAVPLVVMAGKEYGCGSSRDWAAKGPALLGVRAVIAESFERIHRSNLVGMGVLPLQFPAGKGRETLGLDGTETLDITGISGYLKPGMKVTVDWRRPDGMKGSFEALARLDTEADCEYYRHGGILLAVLRGMAAPA